MSETGREPAFPGVDFEPAFPGAGPVWEGMSLRDYFAAHAMAGLLAYKFSANSYGETAPEQAGKAYAIADAMLAERRKSK